MVALAIVLGAVVGGSLLDGGGFVVGAVIGWLAALVLRQRGQLEALQQRVQRLEGLALPTGAAEDRGVGFSPPAVNDEEAGGPKPTRQTAAAESAEPPPAAVPTPGIPAAEPTAPTWLPPEPATASALRRGTAAFWDWLRGGNPLAKVGVVILFFGAVFLVRYAAERQMFPIELRLAALAVGAMGLLVLGWRLRRTRSGYAQVLQGGGIAGLYLVSFAAARLYGLLPLPAALAVMVAVAVLAAVMAVAQNALAMAVIGTGGGFLAPLLLSTGEGSHVALFSYYAILNLGVFTVAWFRAWRVLNLVGFVFTFGIVGLFRGTGYEDADRLGTTAFLLLFFAMYVGVSVLFALRQKPDFKGAVSASLVFGLPVAVFGIHASLWSDDTPVLALSALGFGGFYLALARLLWNRHRETLRLLCEAFAALGVIFVSLAVPLAFTAEATAVTWAAESAGLMWLGVRQGRSLTRAFALLLHVAGFVSLCWASSPGEAVPVLINPVALGFLLLGVSALFCGHWLRREATPEAIPRHERGWSTGFTAVGALWLWWVSLAEKHRAIDAASLAGLDAVQAVHPSLTWLAGASMGFGMLWLVAMALVAQALARRLAWRQLDHGAAFLMALAAVSGIPDGDVAAQLGVDIHPAMLGGALAWPLWFAVQYGVLLRRAPQIALRDISHFCSALLLIVIAGWEARWRLTQALAEAPQSFWPELPFAALFAATLVLLARTPLVPAWPLAANEWIYRGAVARVVAAAAALWLLLQNLTSSGDAAPLVTLPLLNPLDLASLALLLALVRWGLVPANREGLPIPPWLLLAGLAALAFVWMSAALVRGLHYGIGTPLFGQGAMESVTLQAALSVFWSLIAFATMLLASQRGLRPVWLAGAALMAVVVAKLFLVDTAGTGTLARIVAFFSVGGVVLVTGYFSPLPPARAKPVETA